jgi:hypothetical protein
LSLTKKEVLTHPAYLRLSDSDKKFVNELLENGNDKRAAAHATWNCAKDAVADAMANKSLRKKNVKFLMDEYLGVDPTQIIPSRDQLAAFAWSKAQASNDGNEAHKWATMVSRVMGYDIKPQASPENPESATPADDSNDEYEA